MATKTKTKSAKRIKNAKKNGPELERLIDELVPLFEAGLVRAKMKPDDLAAKLKISKSRVRKILDGRAMSCHAVTDVLKAMNLRLVVSTAPLRS